MTSRTPPLKAEILFSSLEQQFNSMENQNLEDKTQVDNLEQQAVNEQLLAGKFKSKDALIESTANLIKQVEGRDMTPTEILKLNEKPDDELESVYKGLERQFHTNRPTSPAEPENGNGEIEEAYKVLDQWAAERGYVKKDELKAQEYEESELNAYLAQNPGAKKRVDLIKTLSKTDDFKSKSFAEVDQFITSQIPQADKSTRTEKMGNSMAGSDDWSPEAIREQLKNSSGSQFR